LRNDITNALLLTALAEHVVDVGEQDLRLAQSNATATDSKYRAGQASVADTLPNRKTKSRSAATRLLTEHRRLAHEQFTLNRLLIVMRLRRGRRSNCRRSVPPFH